MKNAVFWDVAPCRCSVNRRSSEKSVYIRSTQRHIPEDGIHPCTISNLLCVKNWVVKPRKCWSWLFGKLHISWKDQAHGIYRRVLHWKSTEILEEHGRLYLQGQRNQHEEGSKQSFGFLLDLFNSEDGGDMFLRNLDYTFNRLHDFISQKIELFIATSMRT
jgi:hypothetical protein